MLPGGCVIIGPSCRPILIGLGGTQQAAAPALCLGLPPAEGKTGGIFCHCQPPKFPSEALVVLVRGAVTRQAYISTLLFLVRRPGAQPPAVTPRPSSRRQHCSFSCADFIILKGKASLGTVFKQISWGNGWFSSLRCELLHPQALWSGQRANRRPQFGPRAPPPASSGSTALCRA